MIESLHQWFQAVGGAGRVLDDNRKRVPRNQPHFIPISLSHDGAVQTTQRCTLALRLEYARFASSCSDHRHALRGSPYIRLLLAMRARGLLTMEEE